MTTQTRRATDVPAPRPRVDLFLDVLWSVYVAATAGALTIYLLADAVPSTPLALAATILTGLVVGHVALWLCARGWTP